jgi:hypothetical protein
MGDSVTVVKYFHVAQRVMAAIPHHHPVLRSAHHNSTARHAVYGHARMAVQVNARARVRGSRVPGLAAIGQRRIAPSIDDHGAVPPGRA